MQWWKLYETLFHFGLTYTLFGSETLQVHTPFDGSCRGVMEGRVRQVQGDLFSCPSSHSLAHCISADCRLGKGIAAIFKRKFGGISELIEQRKKPGEVAVLRRGTRYIYCLVTKGKYFDKPSYESVRRSLVAVRDHCSAHDVHQLAMPRIGCGLDGLCWDQVSGMIESVFEESCVQVTVYTV